MRHRAVVVLPTRRDEVPPPKFPAKEVTKVALRLKYQIEQVIPWELDEPAVTRPHSSIITRAVVDTAKQAGGDEYAACVAFCLLVVKKWFTHQATRELWDSNVHNLRAIACEIIAKRIIEAEEDLHYLLQRMLLKRYSIFVNNAEKAPINVVEMAIDLHALTVIGSSGYQKCISHLWNGWVVQDGSDSTRFVGHRQKMNPSYWSHFHPDRMRVPLYQNAAQVAFSVIYVALYTWAINTTNPSVDLDVLEVVLYAFTIGFVCEEAVEVWASRRIHLSFWNIFNFGLYALLTVAFVLRMVAVSQASGPSRDKFNTLSYNFLASTAPMFWGRLVLYLDTFRFLGAMLVVVKTMMKESLIFFALLAIILVGFLQAFIGLNQVDNRLKTAQDIIQAMVNAIMQYPDFNGFENYAPPFGITLYYIYAFVVMVVLLNILIALYNSAYNDITSHALDEFMALFARKTMQFVRAPEEKVFIAPLNLVQIFCLIIPCKWWMSEDAYSRLCDHFILVLYSPLLMLTAALETRQARTFRSHHRRSEEFDDVVEEWQQMDSEVDFERDGWAKMVDESRPNVETKETVLEIQSMKAQIQELQTWLKVEKMERSGGGL